MQARTRGLAVINTSLHLRVYRNRWADLMTRRVRGFVSKHQRGNVIAKGACERALQERLCVSPNRQSATSLSRLYRDYQRGGTTVHDWRLTWEPSGDVEKPRLHSARPWNTLKNQLEHNFCARLCLIPGVRSSSSGKR